MDLTELVTNECDSCLGTYTGRPVELAGQGWVRHGFTRAGSRRARGSILLCRQCEARFAPVWASKNAA